MAISLKSVSSSYKPSASSASKTASIRKTTSASKTASAKPTSSYNASVSSYKPISEKKESAKTYTSSISRNRYQTASSQKTLTVSKQIVSNRSGVKKADSGKANTTQKSTLSTSSKIANDIKLNLQSKLNISTIKKNATVEAVKKKVEKSLSDAVDELEKTKDYINRLGKAYKGSMDSAAQKICDETSDAIDEAKKVVSQKGGIGKGAVNLLLDGCEKLVGSVVNGAKKLGKGTMSAVIELTENAVYVIGKAIDYVNPAPDKLSVNEIIKKVEKGTIKLDTNLKKGNYGEMKMDQYYEKQGYVRISIDRVMSLDEPARQGIDGVYYNVEQQKGEPTYIIGEAKYNQSKLGYTKYDGKQMSDSWILGRNRLENAVDKDFADDVRMSLSIGDCEKQVVHVFPDGACKVKTIK